MRILGSADHHCDEHKRFDEFLRVHHGMVETARAERVDLFVSAGDVYEGTSSPAERAAVAEWLTAMAEVCPVLIVKGNHDRALDMLLMSRLKTKHPVVVEERAGVHLVGGAAIAAVAWPNRAQLASIVGAGSTEELDATAHGLLQNVLRSLGAQLDAHRDRPRLLLGHFMVDGSVTSVGQPLIGQSMNVGLADLALARAQIGVLGHIHCPQTFRHDDADYLYTGSPFRTAYGEVEEKSVLLIDFDGAQLVGWRRIPTACARMFLIEERYGSDDGRQPTWLLGLHGEPEDEADYKGAEVRFRYSVPADLRDAARRSAYGEVADHFRARGAVDVQIDEEVQTVGTARAPEVAQALTLADKLSALWRLRQIDLSPERTTRLLTKAGELEQEIAA
jgi:DNA repair exonuclease SbcCD nuclease subunit